MFEESHWRKEKTEEPEGLRDWRLRRTRRGSVHGFVQGPAQSMIVLFSAGRAVDVEFESYV